MSLEDLKVGDRLYTSGYGSEIRVYTVERLTKTQLITTCNQKFNIKTGKRLSSTKSQNHLCGNKLTPVVEESILLYEKEGEVRRLLRSLEVKMSYKGSLNLAELVSLGDALKKIIKED